MLHQKLNPRYAPDVLDMILDRDAVLSKWQVNCKTWVAIMTNKILSKKNLVNFISGFFPATDCNNLMRENDLNLGMVNAMTVS